MCHELTEGSDSVGRGEGWRGRGGEGKEDSANNHGNKYLLHRHQMRIFMANQTFARRRLNLQPFVTTVHGHTVQRLAAK